LSTASPIAFDPDTHGWVQTGAYCNLPAALVVAGITVILIVGIRESARFNAAMVLLKLAVVAFVIVVGAFYVRRENWHPYLPHGVSGVFRGAAYIFFAYIGFDSVSTQAEEARNPQRDVPIGIITSLALCTILYILVAAVLTGMVPYHDIDLDAPVALAFGARGLPVAVFLISLGAVVGITSVLLVLLLSQARILLAMARDGLISYRFFGAVHPRFRTPYKASILTGVLVAAVAALFPLKILADLVNIGTLMAFVIVCAAVLVMRLKNPHPKATDTLVASTESTEKPAKAKLASAARCLSDQLLVRQTVERADVANLTAINNKAKYLSFCHRSLPRARRLLPFDRIKSRFFQLGQSMVTGSITLRDHPAIL
jgi:APA family basic amino acid/polyamine antiporter